MFTVDTVIRNQTDGGNVASTHNLVKHVHVATPSLEWQGTQECTVDIGPLSLPSFLSPLPRPKCHIPSA
jgi:hypothetical protein